MVEYTSRAQAQKRIEEITDETIEELRANTIIDEDGTGTENIELNFVNYISNKYEISYISQDDRADIFTCASLRFYTFATLLNNEKSSFAKQIKKEWKTERKQFFKLAKKHKIDTADLLSFFIVAFSVVVNKTDSTDDLADKGKKYISGEEAIDLISEILNGQMVKNLYYETLEETEKAFQEIPDFIKEIASFTPINFDNIFSEKLMDYLISELKKSDLSIEREGLDEFISAFALSTIEYFKEGDIS